jgi:hypothetical protein
MELEKFARYNLGDFVVFKDRMDLKIDEASFDLNFNREYKTRKFEKSWRCFIFII